MLLHKKEWVNALINIVQLKVVWERERGRRKRGKKLVKHFEVGPYHVSSMI